MCHGLRIYGRDIEIRRDIYTHTAPLYFLDIVLMKFTSSDEFHIPAPRSNVHAKRFADRTNFHHSAGTYIHDRGEYRKYFFAMTNFSGDGLESCPVEVVGLRLVKLNKKIAGETDRRKHDITNSRQNSDTTKHRYNV